MKSSNMSIHA